MKRAFEGWLWSRVACFWDIHRRNISVLRTATSAAARQSLWSQVHATDSERVDSPMLPVMENVHSTAQALSSSLSLKAQLNVISIALATPRNKMRGKRSVNFPHGILVWLRCTFSTPGML